MKKALLIAFALAALGGLLVLVLSANRVQKASAPGHSSGEAWSFKEGRGIILSEDASKALGIETAEVQSANIIPERRSIAVQIFRAANENAEAGIQSSGSFFLPSQEARKLAVGQALTLRKDGLSFDASVSSVKEPANGNKGLSEVLATVVDPNSELRVGDFLEAHVAAAQDVRSGVAAIPQSAVVESVRGAFVYAANEGSFLRTPVKLGAVQNGVIEVVDGLFEGDVVAAKGAPGLWMIELQAVNGGKGCGDAH